MKIKNLCLFALLVLVLMSAQVFAASCIDEVQSEKTMDFMNEIPALNAKLDGVVCDNKVPFFKNEVVSVQVVMRDGSKQEFSLTTQKGAFTKIETGKAAKLTHIMKIGECEFDTLLRSDNKGGVFAYLYLEKKVEITAVGFLKKIALFFKKTVMGIALKKIQTPVDIACTV